MRQKKKRRKLLIGIGISLMLAVTAAACGAEGDKGIWNYEKTEEQMEWQKSEEGFCLPGSFTFDMIYPFHLGHRILRFYLYCREQ